MATVYQFASSSLQEVNEDPWLLGALGLGSVMTLAILLIHACCFGAEAAMLEALSALCSVAA